MQTLSNILEPIAIIISALSGFLTFFDIISNKIQQKRKLKKLKEENFELLLQSSDIKALGNYLDNEVGQLTISNYVDNEKIKKEVDVLINKLTRFVGTDEQINKETIVEEKRETEKVKEPFIEYNLPFKGAFKDEFDKIVSELNHGEPWNALARLRRFIEISLKDVALKNNISIEKTYSLIQLIETLKRAELIDIYSARNLKYPIHISNRAIHGDDVDINQAREAVFHGMNALYKIIEDKNFSA